MTVSPGLFRIGKALTLRRMPHKPLLPCWSLINSGAGWDNWRIVMPNFNRIEHPVLNVEIGGGLTDRRPSSFSLVTNEGFPSVQASLGFRLMKQKAKPAIK
jgi:hypothetical protein